MSKTAVIKTGGKQYVVAEGSILTVEKLSNAPQEKGGKFTFDEVLLIDDGKALSVGTPSVKGARVSAEIIEHARHDKVTVIKYRAKSRYFKKNGHKQPYTKVRITDIVT